MTTRRTILVTGKTLVPHEALVDLRDRGFEVRHVRSDEIGDDRLHEALDGVSGYLIGGYEEPRAAHFDAATALEVVAFMGTDYQGYVPGWQRAFELGIALVSCPGANAESVAEFTLLLMLSLARPFTARLLPGVDGDAPSPPGMELSGRTLGVLGAGRIAARVAALSIAFGMRVVYHSRHRSEPLEHALGLRYVSLRGLFETSDVVSLHRSGRTGDEPCAVGERELSVMRPGALLVNAAHRELVDPEALARAIEDRGVRAAFDGFGTGPAWERLLAFGPERVLAMPQMGFHTDEANRRAAGMAVDAVCAVLRGGTSPLVNNPGFRGLRRT
jgi:D-3-phosphoglycerate dehydrogenase